MEPILLHEFFKIIDIKEAPFMHIHATKCIMNIKCRPPSQILFTYFNSFINFKITFESLEENVSGLFLEIVYLFYLFVMQVYRSPTF